MMDLRIKSRRARMWINGTLAVGGVAAGTVIVGVLNFGPWQLVAMALYYTAGLGVGICIGDLACIDMERAQKKGEGETPRRRGINAPRWRTPE